MKKEKELELKDQVEKVKVDYEVFDFKIKIIIKQLSRP